MKYHPLLAPSAMSERTHSRRSVLRGIGAAATATVVGSGLASAQSGWAAVKSPVDVALYDVQDTTAGAYAAGGSGTVIERTRRGWRKTFDGGPTGNGNDLYGAGVTDDETRLWVVGSSGAIGEYDVTTGNLIDRSAPNDVTNNFNDVAVTGEAGAANVYVAGDSGKIYYSFDNGRAGSWDEVTPGSGSNVNAVDFFDARSGHAVDGNKTVFQTDDGVTYDKLGIEDADYNFYGVDSDGFDDVWVAGGGGSIYRWNGSEWRRENLGDPDLRDVEVEGGDGLTVGAGGSVFELSGNTWRQQETPTGSNLRGVLLDSTSVAVGDGGSIIEE